MRRSSTPKMTDCPPSKARKTMRSNKAGGYSRPKVEGSGEMRGMRIEGKKDKGSY